MNLHRISVSTSLVLLTAIAVLAASGQPPQKPQVAPKGQRGSAASDAAFENTAVDQPDAKPIRRHALSPEESLQQIELRDGFSIQLLAAEPDVIDPVDAAFDDAGRLWVVEMRDYPFPEKENSQGRIRVLHDPQGNGRFTSLSTFADQLDMPTGLAIWRDGVVVTVAGKLLWLRDTDGDLTADTQQVWVEGFAEDNEQLRANHPRLGPDGKWYIACGLRGGSVRAGMGLDNQAVAPENESRLRIGSRDIRFDPQTGQIELISGPAQFGLCFDSQGNRYFCSNRNPAVEVVLEQAALDGNPLAGFVPAAVDVLPSGPQSEVFPLVNAWTTSNLHAGQFTAACGVFWNPRSSQIAGDETRLGDKLNTAPELLGSILVCEPTGSLVKRVEVATDGYRTSRVDRVPTERATDEVRREWLASRDAWFRPVNMGWAPDGSLVLVDMHRAVIEHPRWVPEELKNRPDERWGNSAGRLFRIDRGDQASRDFAQTLQDLRKRPLSERESKELADLVGHGNPWARATATRILFERNAKEVIPVLSGLALDSQLSMENRLACVSAAASLNDGLPSRLLGELRVACQSIEPAKRLPLPMLIGCLRAVRAHHLPEPSPLPAAARAAGDPAQSQSLAAPLLHLLAHSQNASLNFEAWLALSSIQSANTAMTGADTSFMAKSLRSPAAQQAISNLVLAGDAYCLTAACAAYRHDLSTFLETWTELLIELSPEINLPMEFSQYQSAAKLLAPAWYQALRHSTASTSGDPTAAATSGTADPIEVAVRLLESRNATSCGVGLALLTEWAGNEQLTAESIHHEQIWNAVHTVAVGEGASSSLNPRQAVPAASRMQVRTAAAELLGYSPRERDWRWLRSQVVDATTGKNSAPASMVTACLSAWGSTPDPQAKQYLLQLLESGTPGRRDQAVRLLAGSTSGLQVLAQAFESEQITAQQLGVNQLQYLATRAPGDLKRCFQQAIDDLIDTDRAQVIEEYRSALELEGRPHLGKLVFRQQCAACHRVDDVGVNVGPDISDTRTQQPIQLLTSILDPNRAVDNNYFRFLVLTHADQVYEGIVMEESRDSIVMLSQNDQRHIVARDHIKQIKASGVSLMPEGLEANIDHQAMADLLAFLKNWRYLDGAIPTSSLPPAAAR